MEDLAIRQLFSRSISELSTFSDVGRLAKRITVSILDSSLESIPQCNQSPEATSVSKQFSISPDELNIFGTLFSFDVASDQTHSGALIKNIWCIANSLEPEIRESLRMSLQKFAEKSFKSDKVPGDTRIVHVEEPDLSIPLAELFLSNAFQLNEFALPRFSPTIELFKMLNQGALACGNTQMKVDLCSQKTFLPQAALITKDIRTSDGWRIAVLITSDEIKVTHYRKEISLGPPSIADTWLLEYSFSIIFSRDMKVLRNCSLTVNNIEFGPLIPTNVRREIERLFSKWVADPMVFQRIQSTNDLDLLPLHRRRSCCQII